MTKPSGQPIDEETLMGYILSALPDSEMEAIERRLHWDASLVQQLKDLRELLAPIQHSLNEEFEPAGDLVSRTMDLVAEQVSSVDSASRNLPTQALSAGSANSTFSLGQRLSSVWESAGRDTRWAWIDSLVVVIAGVCLLCILLPSVWVSRQESRRIACASNLRNLGAALQEYANSNRLAELPKIDMLGPASFAGIYVIKLNDAKLLNSSNLVWCPSRDSSNLNLGIPSLNEFLNASPVDQDSWRKTVGGTYAYNLGNIIDGRYVTPRVKTPLPVPIVGDIVSLEKPAVGETLIHGENVANLLYTDGRVVQMQISNMLSPHVDHPYLNRKQIRAVGLGNDDTCLAPSFIRPLQNDAQWPDGGW